MGDESWAFETGSLADRSYVELLGDMIWMTQAARLHGFCQAIKDQGNDQLVLAVAHFPATLAQVKQELWDQSIPYVAIEGRLTAVDVRRYGRESREADVLLAQDLVVGQSLGMVADGAKPLTLLIAERHFLPAKDEYVVEFARSLEMPSRLAFHLSLDDPLLRAFAGDWVKGVLGDLGMKESESIVSQVVTKRIRKAQDRLAEQESRRRTST